MNLSDEYIYDILLKHGIPENQKVLRAVRCVINLSGLEEIMQDDPDDLNLARMEQRYISKAMTRFNGDKTKAAKALGITGRTLYTKLKEYDIKGVKYT